MEAKKMNIDEFEELLNTAYELKKEASELDAQKKKKEAELMELNRIILEEFNRLDKTSYKTNACQVIRVQKQSVKMPKDPDGRGQFFKYLKKLGCFEDLVSINHNTLNAFYKQEFEEAKRQGNFEFEIPGLEAPTLQEYITYRKN